MHAIVSTLNSCASFAKNPSMAIRGQFDRVRRHLEERIDQAWALAWSQIKRRRTPEPFDGDPRFALITVNRSTTRYLKLMLLTLAEQSALRSLKRIIIVDNDSRDGGDRFLHDLAARIERVSVLRNRFFLSHARGMRRGLDHLDALDASVAEEERANIVISCDTDVIFRRIDTLAELGKLFVEEQAALAGELRNFLFPYPEAQASFIAVRRDCYSRRDIAPWVNHGSPSYWMQRSIWRAGLPVIHFPSNYGGFILHRGRAGVAAASAFSPFSSYASIDDNQAHYMGVPDGAEIWGEVEARWAELLSPENEDRLLEHFAQKFQADD